MANAVTLPGERLAGLWEDLACKIRKGGITLDELALFNQRKNPFEHVTPTPNTFPLTIPLTIDYDRSLEEMIAAGRYDWKNSDITAKRFPLEGEDMVEFESRYFHFNHNISSEKAIEAMKKAGWEPARIEHLLCFGEKYPDEQRKFPIIGLGSVAEVRGNRSVPYLPRSDSECDLDLLWFGSGWSVGCRFLAVRKVSGA